MVVKFQTSDKSNGNKGSSSALTNYLEKEDLEAEQKAFENGEIPEQRKGFFNNEKNGITKEEVIDRIDNNKKKLGRDDAKFYSVTFSLSEKEQKHILKNITDKEISNINELDKTELKAYEKELENYTRNSMNEYATHFNRKGLENGNQLVYYGKIEHNRNYKGNDQDVKNGLAKSGELKPGLNSHVHLIVSRKDQEQRLKLSPMANERNNANAKVNNKTVQRGFDRNLYNVKAEKVFDKQFNYNRELNEKVEHRIQASKDIEKSTKLELTTDQNKREIQGEIINDFDKRNGYTEKDKELSHEIEPSFEKEQEKAQEQPQKQNESDYEIEY